MPDIGRGDAERFMAKVRVGWGGGAKYLSESFRARKGESEKSLSNAGNFPSAA
jgi:hypothetical protein